MFRRVYPRCINFTETGFESGTSTGRFRRCKIVSKVRKFRILEIGILQGNSPEDSKENRSDLKVYIVLNICV